MADWVDGTSNQLIIGEKYVPPFQLNSCLEYSGPSATSKCDRIDCSSYYLADNNYSAAAMFLRDFPNGPLVKRAEDTVDKAPSGDYTFGSYHPGLCQFLKGDGSVHAIMNNTLAYTLEQLIDTADGGTPELP